MKTSKLLEMALKKIEKGWCQGSFAQDKNGKPVYRDSQKAVKWCAIGAIYAVNTSSNIVDAWDFLEQSLPKKHIHIPVWNDKNGRTKEQVINLYKRAIARAKKAEQKISKSKH